MRHNKDLIRRNKQYAKLICMYTYTESHRDSLSTSSILPVVKKNEIWNYMYGVCTLTNFICATWRTASQTIIFCFQSVFTSKIMWVYSKWKTGYQKKLTLFGWISILRTRSVLSQSKKPSPLTDLTPRRWPP